MTCMCVHVVLYVLAYLAGAYCTAVKAGFPVFPVASDDFILRAVPRAPGSRRAHTVIASREIHTHTGIPAGVCLYTALINICKDPKSIKKQSYVVEVKILKY